MRTGRQKAALGAAIGGGGCCAIVAVLAGITVLGAVVGGNPEPTASPVPTATVSASAPAATTSAAPSAAADPFATCGQTPAETPLAQTIVGVAMPPEAKFRNVQEVAPASDEDQSLTDVVVYLCTTGIDEDEQRRIATDIASAVKGTPEGASILRFFVHEFVVEPDGEMESGTVLWVDDFRSYTWDRGAARPPESIWEAKEG